MAAVLLAPPILLAVAMGIVASGLKSTWNVVILVIATCQALILYFTAPASEAVLTLVVSVFAPWGAVVGLLSVSGYPRRPIVTAVALPIVYALTLGVGVVVGVNLGVLRV